jgi:hypothetical protein
MTANEAKQAFLAVPGDRKARVVALVGHNLTICARGAYPGQVEDQVSLSRLTTFNELQHTITAKLMQLGAAEPNRFPDDAFVDVLFEKAARGKCENALVWALAQAVSQRW